MYHHHLIGDCWVLRLVMLEKIGLGRSGHYTVTHYTVTHYLLSCPHTGIRTVKHSPAPAHDPRPVPSPACHAGPILNDILNQKL